MPNGKPDPNCVECKGTGQITLFTSSCICDCVNHIEPTLKQIGDNFNKTSDFEYYIDHRMIPNLPPPKIRSKRND